MNTQLQKSDDVRTRRVGAYALSLVAAVALAAGCGTDPGEPTADNAAASSGSAADPHAGHAVATSGDADPPGSHAAAPSAGGGPAADTAATAGSGSGADAAAVPLALPAGAGSGQPHLAVDAAGQAVVSWLEPDDAGHVLKFSRLLGGAWSAPQVVAQGDDFFVSWADFPSVQPITQDVWAAHWLKRAPDSFASYDVVTAVSNDGGETWSEGSMLNDDGHLTEHGFVSLFPWGGDIGAIWLDGRLIAEQFETGEFDENAPPVGMSLRFARIAYDGQVREQGQLDELACDCCQTDAAVTSEGPVIVYRDRTPNEIRDNVVRRWTSSGWQSPVTLGPDGWRIEGCPVNGPAIAAEGATVAAAWFTAPGGEPKTRFARSSDGGATFGAPVDVAGQGSFGQVGVVLLDDGAAAVSAWRSNDDGGLSLAVWRIDADGGVRPPRIVATNDSAQPIDVPQMVRTDEGLVFAWTDARDETVRSAYLTGW